MPIPYEEQAYQLPIPPGTAYTTHDDGYSGRTHFPYSSDNLTLAPPGTGYSSDARSTHTWFQSNTTTPRISMETTRSGKMNRSNSMVFSDASHLTSLRKLVEARRDVEKAEEPLPDLPSLPSRAPSDPEKSSLRPLRLAEKLGKSPPPKDPNLVEWDGPDDPENPMNWGTKRKWILTLSLAVMTFTITFASSVFSTATTVVAEEFHISPEVSTLGTSLFVLGFALGPLVWGPVSELVGRMTPLFSAFTVFIIFQIPVAVAVNVETIMLCRFVAGAFGSAPLAIIGGCLADFWGAVDRGIAVTVFAAAVFIGPAAGPIAGGFITQSYLGWRWTLWITMIMATVFGLITLSQASETSHPIILQRRAARLRRQTKNWALHSARDEVETSFGDIMTRYFTRPAEMIMKEPILLLNAIYISLIYGLVYLLFEAFPISFQRERGWNAGVGSLPFLSITIGVTIGGLYITYVTKTTFARKMAENNGVVVPESRLPPMIVGGCVLPIGLFWFAWTSSPNITWVPQVISGIFIGFGIFVIFMTGFSYLIDVYLQMANSAIAAQTFVRSLAGSGFPLFAVQMYNRLGVAWASSLLAFLCIAMIPVPVIFYLYGKKLRSMSKFTPKL